MTERLQALRAGPWANFAHTDEPVCPHCGTECKVSEQEWWDLYNDQGEREFKCPSCAEKFSISVHTRYTFSTDEQEDDDDCPKCMGSGEMIAQAGAGPDTYDVTVSCSGCSGTGYRS